MICAIVCSPPCVLCQAVAIVLRLVLEDAAEHWGETWEDRT